jgi:hypothetical protein
MSRAVTWSHYCKDRIFRCVALVGLKSSFDDEINSILRAEYSG